MTVYRADGSSYSKSLQAPISNLRLTCVLPLFYAVTPSKITGKGG